MICIVCVRLWIIIIDWWIFDMFSVWVRGCVCLLFHFTFAGCLITFDVVFLLWFFGGFDGYVIMYLLIVLFGIPVWIFACFICWLVFCLFILALCLRCFALICVCSLLFWLGVLFVDFDLSVARVIALNCWAGYVCCSVCCVMKDMLWC